MNWNIPKSLWLCLVGVLSFCFAADHLYLFFFTALKYVPFFLVIALVFYYAVVSKFTTSYVSLPVIPFSMLLLYALPGLIYGKVQAYPTSLATSLGLGFVVISAQLIPADRLGACNERTILRFLVCLSLFFTYGSLLLLIASFVTDIGLEARIHERAFLLPIAAVALFLLKEWFWTLVAVVGMVCVIILDKRTTMLLIYAVSAAAVVLWHFPHRVRVIIFTITVLVAPFGYEAVKELTYYFKVTYGQQASDNTEFREILWGMALDQFYESPVFGNFFTQGGAYDLTGSGFRNEMGELTVAAPLHNDYLECLVSGGIIGLSLFVAGLLSCMFVSYRNASLGKLYHLHDYMIVNYVLFVALVGAMINISANPSMNNPAAGFLVYLTCALIIVMDRKLMVLVRSQRRMRQPH